MYQVLDWLDANYSLTALILLCLFALGVIVFFAVIIRLNKVTRQYKALMKGAEGRDLEDLLMANAKTLEHVLFKMELIDQRLKTMEQVTEKCIQRVGIVRFNAFKEMGGDLSYSIALLDKKGNGVVISSIYSRDDARSYAKPIKAGKSAYKLSEEEELAIHRTIRDDSPK